MCVYTLEVLVLWFSVTNGATLEDITVSYNFLFLFVNRLLVRVEVETLKDIPGTE